LFAPNGVLFTMCNADAPSYDRSIRVRFGMPCMPDRHGVGDGMSVRRRWRRGVCGRRGTW
jgi:hypothetical protein